MSFLNWIADTVYRNRSNAWKAALSTAIISFVSLFSVSLLGFIGDLTEWANDSTGTAVFPSVAPLMKAFISAALAAFIGLVNWVFRLVQANTAIIPGTGPSYPAPAPPAVD